MGFDRAALEACFDQPGHPLAEGAGLWRMAVRALDAEPLAGKRVVDFECRSGEIGLWMANEGAEVYLLDFKREVVDAALDRAKSYGLERRVRGILVFGTQLDMFADRGFDLVFLRGLPARELLEEIARAMKPGARLVAAARGEAVEGGLDHLFDTVRRQTALRKRGWLTRFGSKGREFEEAVFTARRL